MRRGLLFAFLCAGVLVLWGCGPRPGEVEERGIAVWPGQSVQDAIDRAPPGAVIQLGPGKWQENLHVSKPLTLRGAGMGKTVLVGGRPGQPVLRVSGEAEVDVVSLSLQGGYGGYTGPALSPAGLFAEEGARVRLEQVELVGNSGAGAVARDQARVEIVRGKIRENNRYGVEVWGQAQIELRETPVLRNKTGGVWVDENGVFQGEDAALQANQGPGIWARGASRVHLTRSEVRGNRGPGIHAQDGASLELRSSQIAENQEYGALVGGASVLVAHDTAFLRNWYGLYSTGGEVFLEGCAIWENEWDGVRLHGKATAAITRTEIAGGQGSGVAVLGMARARLKFNRITGFAVAGVYAFAASPVEGEGNVLEGNAAHVLGWVEPHLREPTETARYETLRFPHPDFPTLQAAVDALLPGGTLEIAGGNHEAGVVVDKPLEIHAAGDAVLRGRSSGPVFSLVAGGRLRLVGGHITGGSDGLALSAGSSAELVDCWLWENTVGIRLWHDSQLAAVRVSIAHHPQGGIWAWDQSQALLEEVTFYANETCGIGAGGLAHVRVVRSTFVENAGQAAVLLLDRAQAELRENVFSGSRGYGVDVWPSFSGQITGGGNVFEGNWRGAVRLAELSFLGE